MTWRHKTWLWPCLPVIFQFQHHNPTDTRRKNNVIVASKRRRNVVLVTMTFLLRRVPVGLRFINLPTSVGIFLLGVFIPCLAIRQSKWSVLRKELYNMSTSWRYCTVNAGRNCHFYHRSEKISQTYISREQHVNLPIIILICLSV